ncbi:hypothetical protein FGO68_gene10788 [Halteria grandinella]|uniref:Uncharacterized protein n=1 Tax=Halteria grandinella TaxID=5974 RepID=A0A8J8NVB8_HALGN|nr:hypothetical protein FGO68_gene10788 [Halteria grandinella]
MVLRPCLQGPGMCLASQTAYLLDKTLKGPPSNLFWISKHLLYPIYHQQDRKHLQNQQKQVQQAANTTYLYPLNPLPKDPKVPFPSNLQLKSVKQVNRRHQFRCVNQFQDRLKGIRENKQSLYQLLMLRILQQAAQVLRLGRKR